MGGSTPGDCPTCGLAPSGWQAWWGACCNCNGGCQALTHEWIHQPPDALRSCSLESYQDQCESVGFDIMGCTACNVRGCPDFADAMPCCAWHDGIQDWVCLNKVSRERDCCLGSEEESPNKRGTPITGAEMQCCLDPEFDPPGCTTCTSCPGEPWRTWYASCCDCRGTCRNYSAQDREFDVVQAWERDCRADGYWFEACTRCNDRANNCLHDRVACCFERSCDPLTEECCDPIEGIDYDCENITSVCCQKRGGMSLGEGSTCGEDDCCKGDVDKSRCCLCNWCCDIPKVRCEELGGWHDVLEKQLCSDPFGGVCTGVKIKPRCEREIWRPFFQSPWHRIVSDRRIAMWDTPIIEWRFVYHKGKITLPLRSGIRYHAGVVCGMYDRIKVESRTREDNICSVITQNGSLDASIRSGYSVFGCGYRCSCPPRPDPCW